MQKVLNFDQRYNFSVREEIVNGLLFRINPIKDDGAGGDLLCDIADLNKIAIEVNIIRESGRTINQVKGYLDDNLLGMYAQNVKLALVKAKTGYGYMLRMDWGNYAVDLRGKDELQVIFYCPKIAFTSTIVSRSQMEFETLVGTHGTSLIPQVEAFPIGNGEQQVDRNLGSGVVKIVAATDFTTDYLTSDKAKITTGDLKADGGYNKPFSEITLFSDNQHYFDNNPESAVEDMVLYLGKELNSVKLKATLSKAADEFAKIIVVRLVPSY